MRVSVREWWTGSIHIRSESPKALASLMMLISWEIWSERNARIFRNTAAPSAALVSKIKEELSLWALAGAKHLSIVMARE
uniref:Uncharacterized protein n=1 Tax=Triticum aestivum TaxID=4565 RepID=A0A3B6FNS0_WHEAT